MLANCHQYRNDYYNTFYNIILLVCFVGSIGCILYYRHKGKMTFEEKEKKRQEMYKLVMLKYKNYQDYKKRLQGELLTTLPAFERI
jgi:hypothetical protein